jgi:cytochrome c peroxidase
VVPVPPDNPATPEKIALGAALFADTRLSSNGTKACISCHDPAQGFSDGQSRGQGVAGVALKRNTPSLWNLAWGKSFFWDGRAATLEAQARGPIEHPLEMNMPLKKAVMRLKQDPKTVDSFKAVFGSDGITETNVVKALSAYERTLVSPKTRFDKWVEGDETALSAYEKKGYELFAGRAGCAKCHTGWRFTDEAFHDIGLPSTPDTGRSAISGLPHNDHAFKTPSLRELVWTGPYMHDGAMATIEAANDHYFGGIENLRSSLSKDLLVLVPVFTDQRRQITAFLKTLSSETQPVPVSLPAEVVKTEPVMAVETARVIERGSAFHPRAVRLRKGQPLTIVNEDDRTHAVLVDDPRLKFSQGVQEPGQAVELTFPKKGTYTVGSSIRPGMELRVELTD